MVSLLMAVRGLSANKLRSALTTLGVIFGVSAVIVAVAISQGARVALAESMQRLGTNTLTVFPGRQSQRGVSFGFGSVNTMTLEDAAAILRQCPSVGRVSPSVNRSAQVKYKNKNNSTNIQGTGEDYPVISNHDVAEGRYFTQQEVRSRQRVAVLGSGIWKDLFDQVSPINKTIRVKGTSFTVVGRLKEKGGFGFRNPDDAVYVPVTTAMRRLFGMDNVQNITCQARTDSLMQKAQDEIDALLRKRHKTPTMGTADFMIFNQADLVEAQSEQQDTTAGLVFIMAIVSLVVGGIGIMNIMLVTVTERTREIGVRKAIGAKRRNIMAQFLLEALFLSMIGGFSGALLGITAANIVGAWKEWTIVIAPEMVGMAFSFSALVGMVAGMYPAHKASRLNPIEALRFE